MPFLPGADGDMPTTSNPTTGPDPSSTAGEPGTSSTSSAGSTGNENATTIAPDPEACGNNVLDPGEQCDLGFASNHDDGGRLDLGLCKGHRAGRTDLPEKCGRAARLVHPGPLE